MPYRFCSKLHRLSNSAKIFENRLTFDKVTESLKVESFFETKCIAATYRIIYRVTCIIVNDFECKNKCLRFVTKLYICYCHIRDFIKIMSTKFQQCGLLNYFVTVYLVKSPKITTLLRHSEYIIVQK